MKEQKIMDMNDYIWQKTWFTKMKKDNYIV